MAQIHPTALVDGSAKLAADVVIGAYSVIGAEVEIGAGTTVGPHVVIEGPTRIGERNRIFQFCSLGAAPQDKKYANELTRLEIGDDNTIREFCTFNRGTLQDTGVTRLGNQNWVMAYVHLAHDCQVGNHCIFANNSQLAGHVQVGDWVILGGFTGVHQFVRIGCHSMTAVATVLLQDLPPYVMASGNPSAPHGINSEGLKRRGFAPEAIMNIKRAYKTLYRSGLSLAAAAAEIGAANGDEIKPLTEFLAVPGRGIVR